MCLEECSLAAYRREVEKSDTFRATRASILKLVQAARRASESGAGAEVKALAKDEQRLKDLASGAYGAHGVIFDAHVADAKAAWMRRGDPTRDGDADAARIKEGKWSRLATTIRQIAESARRRIAEGVVVNADISRVQAYIDAHSHALVDKPEDSHGDLEFASHRKREFDEVSLLIWSSVGVKDATERKLQSRLRRVVWGFATRSEAEKVAEECAKLAAAEPHEAEQVAARVLETHEKAANTVKHLNRVAQVLDLNVILISRLESIVAEWFHEWHDWCAKAGGAAAVWGSHYLRSNPEAVFSDAMKICAGDTFRGRYQKLSKWKNTVTCGLEGGAAPRGWRNRNDLDALTRSERTFIVRAREHVARLEKECQETFYAFADDVMTKKFPWLYEATVVGDQDGGPAVALQRVKIIHGEDLKKSAQRWAISSQTQMRVHAKTRWRKLVETEIAALQVPDRSYGVGARQKEKNAAAMRRFLRGNAKRRKRLLNYVGHYLRWHLSQGYAKWCKKKDLTDAPGEKLLNEADSFDVSISGVLEIVDARVKSVVELGAGEWAEVVCVISRATFTTDKDVAAEFDALSAFTDGCRRRCTESRDAIKNALGEENATTNTFKSNLFNVESVRRFAIETAMEDVFSSRWSLVHSWMNENGDARSWLQNSRAKRVLKRIVRHMIRDAATKELQGARRDGPFVGNGEDHVEEFKIRCEEMTMVSEETPAFEPNAKAASRILRGVKEFQESLGEAIVDTMARVQIVIENVRDLYDAALKARDDCMHHQQRDRTDEDEDEDEDEDKDKRLRLSSRARKAMITAMAVAVRHRYKEIADTVERPTPAGGTDGEGDTGDSPSLGGARAPENAATSAGGEASELYWLPTPIGGRCSAISQLEVHVRHQYADRTMLADLVKYSPRLDEEAIFQDRRNIGAAKGERGTFIARSLFAPRLSGLAASNERGPTSSGSVLSSNTSFVYRYEDFVPKDDRRLDWRCERQPLRPGEERTSPRDVVFVGCDPGMNKPLSLVAVFPQTTKEQPNKVATYSWQHYATSARKLSAATRPKQRAEENRRRRNEAVKSTNSEDPASESNAIAMAKSARDVDGEKTHAFVLNAKAYALEAQTIADWITHLWRTNVHEEDENRFPTIVMSVGVCGVIQGRGWRNNPLKSGVARTSPSRLILELAKTYAGRLEIDLVEEHGTSVSCPCCNKKLSPFRGDNLVFPTEGYGKRLRSINRRNGRVCEDVLCSWGRSCENRDVIGAINMLRRFYKVYEDLAYSNDEDERQRGESHGYERELLAKALKVGLSIDYPAFEFVRNAGDDGADDEDGADADATVLDDEVLAEMLHETEHPSLAAQRSPASTENARAIRDIASTAKKQARERTPGSTPDRDAALRVRVRSPRVDSERPEAAADEEMPRRKLSYPDTPQQPSTSRRSQRKSSQKPQRAPES